MENWTLTHLLPYLCGYILWVPQRHRNVRNYFDVHYEHTTEVCS